jgi:hypothetical protein
MDYRLTRNEIGQLLLECEGATHPVRVKPCFPWTEPVSHFSIRDESDVELALVRTLDDLDPESRRAMEMALAEAGFVLQIDAITSVTEEFEIFNWKARTRQGERTFQTKRDEWPRPVPGGGLLIRDVAGDLYYVASPDALDAQSRKLLWAFRD